MKNISFDNPYWLIIAIPLIAALLVPYFISVSKDNRSKRWIASLIVHVMIVLSLSLAASGLVHTTVKTRTRVYVLADVSYSSERNLDEIDAYIQQIQKNLPPNSLFGIVCFGNDYSILSLPYDDQIKSVKESTVDDNGTNIAAAIDYTSMLFSEDEIKRIVLITDGFATSSDGSTASAIANAAAKGIKIDTVYLNNNLRQGEEEVQISDVSYSRSTYLGHENRLDVLIESNTPSDVFVDLSVMVDGEYTDIDTKAFKLDDGVNVVSFDLPSDASGVYDYRVSLSSPNDFSEYNNTYYFTQTVAGQRKVLLVTEKYLDQLYIESIYGDSAEIDSRVISDESNKIPYTIEELVKYDEIILSNVDIRKIDNIYAFVDSVDLVVSQYGKSLITLGDLSMQNQDDEIFVRLEEILPVSFGNVNKDAKLYTIVLDISRSMMDTSQFETAQKAAQKLLSMLDDDDNVAIIALSGEPQVIQIPVRLGDKRQEINQKIKDAEPTQGTFIGKALDMAYGLMEHLSFEQKQVMLISDGLSFTLESENSADIAAKMLSDGIVLSTINVIREDDGGFLKNLASIGGGKYYFIKNQEDISGVAFAEIIDDITDSVVEKQSKVNIESFRDDVMDGILTIPDVGGYVNSKSKIDATTVLSVDYQKNSATVKKVPLYSYREHGNGRVSSFTSSISGSWLADWSVNLKERFFGNLLVTNTPLEHVDYPFNIVIEQNGGMSTIEIIPSVVNPRAKAEIVFTSPSTLGGESIDMTFNLNKYVAVIPTADIGKYSIEINYTYGNHTFTSNTYLTKSYGEEYNAFAAYDIVNIYDFMRGVGRVSEDGNLSFENAKNEVDTYEVSFRVPLLIFAVSLFVIDVILRKFGWDDIKGLFTTTKKEEVEQ